MKIRSITYFCSPGWPLDVKILQAAGVFLAEAKGAFEAAGYEVQTTRLASMPFSRLLGARKITETPRLAEMMGAAIQATGIDYAALGPALPEFPYSYLVIPEAIAASQNVFFSGVMADAKTGLSLAAVRACAEVICRCAPITPDGFANLRFAALANVPPGAPFFPAAYHEGDVPAFALATEAADLAVQAFAEAKTVDDGRRRLIAAMEAHARKLVAVADLLKYRYSLRFGGIDYSLAPYPEESRSLGAAFERMGVPRVGLHGSLAAAALLAESIQRAHFPHAGFSGVMLPVLEDAVLARRAAEGILTVKDLLLYSAVCGAGLDTLPLPGDTTVEQISPLLLDLSALALRLDKPLTARLMPIPGKKAGDPTDFDFAYFANSRVMALEAEPLQSPLLGSESFELKSR
ncbi:MAG: DUF711 domain-containing protein [Anaerolineae bacterium CG_4_9_14_0_8_um_filter_58_9]|nr:MAG: DUF711 domain-containing protein [Anaerolineae bacterium CG_4_9_14_0_8_um_filter_58_9]